MFEGIFKDILTALKYFVGTVFSRPVDIKKNSMNEPDNGPTDVRVELPEPTAAEQLCATAKQFLGKDASPRNLAPQELSCAESVVNIVNTCWPGTLDTKLVGTDELDTALRKSKRFKATLDPVPGSIEVSPKAGAVHGHAGIYVYADYIASNDSKSGTFKINYTRQTWRIDLIKKRGLKAHLFTPVDL